MLVDLPVLRLKYIAQVFAILVILVPGLVLASQSAKTQPPSKVPNGNPCYIQLVGSSTYSDKEFALSLLDYFNNSTLAVQIAINFSAYFKKGNDSILVRKMLGQVAPIHETIEDKLIKYNNDLTSPDQLKLSARQQQLLNEAYESLYEYNMAASQFSKRRSLENFMNCMSDAVIRLASFVDSILDWPEDERISHSPILSQVTAGLTSVPITPQACEN